MEFSFKGDKIVFNRELSDLDKLVLKFVGVLDAHQVDYVIISGYVAILFGRSRNTEDVDLFVEKMSLEKFGELWSALEKAGFECVNESKAEDAYGLYLQEGLAIRFAEEGRVIPNFELKFPKTDLNRYSLKNRLEVELNGRHLVTSKFELQIAYKLYLGSDKDIEDAAHLWQLFKNHLDKKLFTSFCVRLEVVDKIKLLD